MGFEPTNSFETSPSILHQISTFFSKFVYSFFSIIFSYTSLHDNWEPAATNMAQATASAIISSVAPCFFARWAWISVHRSHLISTEAVIEISSFVRRSSAPSLYTEFLNSENAFATSGVFSLNHDKFYSSFLLVFPITVAVILLFIGRPF